MRRYGAIGVVIAVASCNYDWTYRPDAGATTPGKDASTDPGDPNVDSGTPPGGSCSSIDPKCPDGQYCFFADRHCGADEGGLGKCQIVPETACKGISFCSCDGTALADPCEHVKVFRDYDESQTTCGGGSGTFKCGDKVCTSKLQYCHSKISAASYECQATSDCTDCKCLGFDGGAGCTCDATNPAEIVVKCE